MDYILIILPLVLFLLAYKFIFSSKRHRVNLPPGPTPFPIVGHLHLVKPPVHRLFHRFAEKYGEIFSLRYGSRRVVVISSLPLVKESFTGQNDVILSNRPHFLTAKYVAYDYTTLGTTDYGDHWRNLRRICSLEILSSHRLTGFLSVRKDEIRRLLTRLSRDHDGGVVELEPLLGDLTFNNIIRMVTGRRYYGDEVNNNSGASHPGDYLPILKVFGHNYEKKVKALGEAMDAFLQRLLDGCRRDGESNTMVSHLLSQQQDQPEYYSDVIIKGLMLAMMLAGTDTSAVTLEWAMASLLRNPEVLKKAKAEIDEKIGNERLIDEPDIVNLPYLQNIVSETFRLCPAAPLLVPRTPTEDIKIGGYDVPRGTIVLVNAWAIHRDPKLWDEPERFMPERFEDQEAANANKLMVFGNGRRTCPGAALGQKMVTLALGSLIQCFEWEKVNGDEIDMTENPGMAMRKLVPLRAVCHQRPIMNNLLA
ncbi:hypothetical protein AALP_AA8G361100 [Arabis alpina]|uniref:Uncharacterized protein n=1 Tax=Arabis alpina TaxID=50452 RepID=A0A087GBM5_ARAAL|nr:hypothetical protein AALP_AA8G361100 [Arabis alpina]